MFLMWIALIFALSITSVKPAPVLVPNAELTTTKTKYLHVLSQIQSRYAITLITSKVDNPTNASQEVSFYVQLPEAAFISNFSMKIGDEIIYGNVKEKEKAKVQYLEAKKSGKSAGLVAEKPRETNAFEISVNVKAYDNVVFNLTYQEMLKRTHGVYKHVINFQPQEDVEDLTIDVLINEQGELVNLHVPKFGSKIGELTNRDLLKLEQEQVQQTVSHSSPTNSYAYITFKPAKKPNETFAGQLVVLYDVKRDNKGGQIEVMNGYFVHFFAPTDLPKGQKTVAFVLDKSGSMYGRKFQQTQEAMRTILKQLDSNDQFNILMFSNEVEYWKSKFVPANEENVKRATQYVMETDAEGGTNIYDALTEAINLLTRSETSSLTSMIIFLTDGEATVGELNSDVIVNNISSLNEKRNFAIHSLAFGNDADFKLVRRISSRNKGLARKVYEDSDAELQLTGFFQEISSPLLSNVEIKYLNETVDIESLVQDSSYNYYDGGEIVVVGRLNDPTVQNPLFDAEIHATSQSGAVSFRSESEIIVCPEKYVIVEGDIMVPCCTGPRCPPIFPPITRPEPVKKPLLPATTIGGFVERMWAYQTIKKLLTSSELETTNKEQLRNKALELSLKYKFVTELTSMIVVQSDQDNGTALDDPKNKFVPTADSRDMQESAFDYDPSMSHSMSHRVMSINLKQTSGLFVPVATTRIPATSSPQICANLTSLMIYLDLTGSSNYCKNNQEFLSNFIQYVAASTGVTKITFRVNTEKGVFDLEQTNVNMDSALPQQIINVAQGCTNETYLKNVPSLNPTAQFGILTTAAENADAVVLVVATVSAGDVDTFVEELQRKQKPMALVNLHFSPDTAKGERWIKLIKKRFASGDNLQNYQFVLKQLTCH